MVTININSIKLEFESHRLAGLMLHCSLTTIHELIGTVYHQDTETQNLAHYGHLQHPLLGKAPIVSATP